MTDSKNTINQKSFSSSVNHNDYTHSAFWRRINTIGFAPKDGIRPLFDVTSGEEHLAVFNLQRGDLHEKVETKIFDNGYIIFARTKEIADTFSMILADLASKNAKCKNYVQEVKDRKRKFVLLPGDANLFNSKHGSEPDAKYKDGMIVISEDYVYEYERLNNSKTFSKSVSFPKKLDVRIKTKESIFRTILHESRHADQADVGLVDFVNKFLEHDLINFVSVISRLEGDACAFADACVQEKNYTRTDFEFLVGLYVAAEFNDIYHFLEPSFLAREWVAEIPSDYAADMEKFADAFNTLHPPKSGANREVFDSGMKITDLEICEPLVIRTKHLILEKNLKNDKALASLRANPEIVRSFLIDLMKRQRPNLMSEFTLPLAANIKTDR